MQLLSVNDAIASIKHLHGQRIYVEGLLTYEYEDISISHWPKSEQYSDSDKSTITIGVSYRSAFSFNHEAMERLAHKRVVVFGQIQDTTDGTSYMSMPYRSPIQIVEPK